LFFGTFGSETHLPTEQARPQAPSWIQEAHVDQEGAPGSGPPARSRPQEAVGLILQVTSQVGVSPSSPIRIERMKRRADFLRAQKFRRQNTPGLTLETCRSPEDIAAATCRVGFTASRKVGSAVERNRAKRRLRAAAASILPLLGREGHDYVLVARVATLSRPYAALLADLTKALTGAHAAFEAGATRGKSSTRKDSDARKES
jgi:ribonuclease P protein component